MPSQNSLKIWAGIGTLLSIPLLYVGLTNEQTLLAILGAGLFVISMLVTPTLQILGARLPLKEKRQDE